MVQAYCSLGIPINKKKIKWCLCTSAELSRGLLLPKLKNPLEIFSFALNYHLLWLFLFYYFSLFPLWFSFLVAKTHFLFQTPSVFRIYLHFCFPFQNGPTLATSVFPSVYCFHCYPHALVGWKAMACQIEIWPVTQQRPSGLECMQPPS